MRADTGPGGEGPDALASELRTARAADDRLRRGRGLTPRPSTVAGATPAGVLEGVGADDDELTALAVRARAGDRDAPGRLVEAALPLVAATARRYAGRDVPLADLVQEGVVAVLRAARRYDPDRGVPFRPYARLWLRQSMQQAIAEQARSVRLPTHVLWDLHELKEARGRLRTSEGGEPRDARLAAELGWTGDHLADVQRAEHHGVSLDAPLRDDEGAGTLGDVLEHPLAAGEFEGVLTRATGEAVRSLLATLTDRERQVLGRRFGLDGEPELSLREIGRRLGVSAERVRQIEERALAKLRAGAVREQA